MKKIIVSFLIIMTLSMLSCGKMATKFIITVHNKSYLYSKATTDEREIIYLPMIHLNKPEYYQMIKAKVDSLRADGYKIYYESVAVDPQMDSISKLEVYRKFRNKVGFVPMDYFAKENYQHQQLKIKGLVMQSFANTGVNVEMDVKADLPMDSLVYRYEEHFGEIKLQDCDLNTAIGQRYKCHRPDKEDYKFIVSTLRDQHLAALILKTMDKKIVLLYGQQHENALKSNLESAGYPWVWTYHHQKINKLSAL